MTWVSFLQQVQRRESNTELPESKGTAWGWVGVLGQLQAQPVPIGLSPWSLATEYHQTLWPSPGSASLPEPCQCTHLYHLCFCMICTRNITTHTPIKLSVQVCPSWQMPLVPKHSKGTTNFQRFHLLLIFGLFVSCCLTK